MLPFQHRALFVGVVFLMTAALGLDSKESVAGIDEILAEIGTWADVGCTHEEASPACQRLKETAKALHDVSWSSNCPKDEKQNQKRDDEIKAFLQEKKDLVTSEYFKKYKPKELAEILECVKALEEFSQDALAKKSCNPDKMEFNCPLDPSRGFGRSPAITLVPSSDCKNIFFITGEFLGKGGFSKYDKGLFYQKEGKPKWQEVARGTLIGSADPKYYVKVKTFMDGMAAQQRPGVLPLLDGTPKHLYYPLYDSDLEKVQGKRPSTFTRLQMLVQAAIGVESLHLNTHNPGYVHRDVKPANVLVKGASSPFTTEAKVSDFDTLGTVGQKNTENGGTPGYAAPERYFGEAHVVNPKDRKGDVYSFAHTVAEVMGHRTDHLMDRVDTILRAKKEGMKNLSGPLQEYSNTLDKFESALTDPPGLGALIKKGLSYDPDNRPSMKEFRKELEAINYAVFMRDYSSGKKAFAGKVFKDLDTAQNAANMKESFVFTPVPDPLTRALRFGVILQDGSGPFAMKSDPKNGREFAEELAEVFRKNGYLPKAPGGMTLLEQAKKAKNKEFESLLKDLGVKK